MDDLGLVKAVDGLCQGIIVAVADGADGGLDPGFRETLGVFDRDVLAAADALLGSLASARESLTARRFRAVDRSGERHGRSIRVRVRPQRTPCSASLAWQVHRCEGQAARKLAVIL